MSTPEAPLPVDDIDVPASDADEFPSADAGANEGVNS